MIRTFSSAVVALLAASVVTVGAAATASAAAAPRVFACADGAPRDYVVPAGVTSVRVRAEGGGDGGVVSATVAVSPGQLLGVIAGCAGGAGYHWGGSGGPSKDGSCADGAPGAGSTAVLTGDLTQVIVEAGGSGGAGGECAGIPGGAGGSGSRAGVDGADGPAPRPAAGGRGGLRATGLGDNGRAGRGRTGAGGGGGGGGCRGGGSGQGGVNKAGAGGGGGSSCAGRLAEAVSFGTGGAGRVVISPELLTATNGGSDVVDANDNGRQDIGDRIAYWVTVRNDGGVPVSNVTVATRRGTTALPLECAPAALAPGETVTCTTEHTLTAADVTARGFTITSTATATSASGTPLTATASRTTKLNPAPGMTLTLDATVTDTDGDGRTDRGDVVHHTATAWNTGGAVLHSVALTGGCTTPALIIGESTACTTSHVITADDMETGTVTAVATASARTPGGQPVRAPAAHATTAVTQDATLAVTTAVTRADTNGSGRPDRGDTLTYTVTTTNTGTVNVSGVVAALPGTTLTCAPETLAPDRTRRCTGTYVLTTADADRGRVTHVASATGSSVLGRVTSAEVPVTTEIPVVATLSVTVTAAVADLNDNELTDAGDELRYTAVLTNEGTVTLTDVAADGLTCAATTLATGESVSCTATHVVTQEDVDGNAPVTRSVTAHGTAPSGTEATSAPATVDTAVSSVPALTVTTRAETDGRAVHHEVVATNTGTVTLHEVSTMDCARPVLAPGQTLTCTGTHEFTQADLDRGFVMTVAGAAGTAPWGEAVRADPSGALTKVIQRPSLTVTNAVAVSGTTLTYTVTTTNSGNVTLTEVAPTLTPAPLTCPATTLAPGETTTCRATYHATGTVTATATASGTTPSGTRITSAAATVTTEIATAAPTPAARGGSGLAWTGITAVTEMIIAGVVVLALGLGLLLFTRRRRRDR